MGDVNFSTGYVYDQRNQRWIRIGGQTSDTAQIHYSTTQNWNLNTELISKQNHMYVYTDYKVITDDVGNKTYVPALKIGDGSTRVIDLPFVCAYDQQTAENLEDHINNMTVHITQAERDFWNNKVSVYKSNVQDDVLIFTTN